jgi:hypothetical protein
MPRTQCVTKRDDPAMVPELCARPITKADAAALIGVLATLQGHAMAGLLDDQLAVKLSDRMNHLDPRSRLEASLDALNQRLRYALGEYDETPA